MRLVALTVDGELRLGLVSETIEDPAEGRFERVVLVGSPWIDRVVFAGDLIEVEVGK